MTAPLLSIDHLTVDFATETGAARALDGVSLSLNRAEILAIVGESGSGKSTLALAIPGLLPPTATVAGTIALDGTVLPLTDDRAMTPLRGRRIGMVFQEPMTALNPVMRVGDQIAEAVELHHGLRGRALVARVEALMARAGIPDPAQRRRAFPHELSGGLRQRATIAMALAGGPDLLVADEPTTALDVLVQAQILDLFRAIRDELGTAILLVTHDLGVVARLADRVLVLRGGRMVETGTTASVLGAPHDPYTAALVAASTLPERHA